MPVRGDPLRILGRAEPRRVLPLRKLPAADIVAGGDFVLVPKVALRFTSGQPKEFASSPGVWRSFCGECGSPIYYRTDRRPDVIDLYAGTLSDPSALTPQGHVHAAEQLPWFEVLDDLPRYPGSRWGDAPMRRGPRQGG